MDIRDLIDEFVSRRRYKPYESICEDVLTSGKSYSLCSQEGCTESEYLQINIRSSVRGYTRNKDNAEELYKALSRAVPRVHGALPRDAELYRGERG